MRGVTLPIPRTHVSIDWIKVECDTQRVCDRESKREYADGALRPSREGPAEEHTTSAGTVVTYGDKTK